MSKNEPKMKKFDIAITYTGAAIVNTRDKENDPNIENQKYIHDLGTHQNKKSLFSQLREKIFHNKDINSTPMVPDQALNEPLVCNHCGAICDENDYYCPNCGAKVRMGHYVKAK